MINRGLMQEVITDILYSSAKHLLTARERRTTLCGRSVFTICARASFATPPPAVGAAVTPFARARGQRRAQNAAGFDKQRRLIGLAFIDERLDFSITDPG
jgi:hypothetical protein